MVEMKRFILTLSELFKRPGSVVDSFLTDRNTMYTHPFIFMLGCSLLILVFLQISDLLFLDLPNVMTTDSENESVAQIQLWVETVSRGMSTLVLPLSSVILLVPALSLSGLIFFRKDLNGFYENLILNVYAVSAATLFGIFWVPILWIYPEVSISNSARFTAAFIMTGMPLLWIYYRYFPGKSPISLIRQISTAASGFIIFILLSGFVSGVLGYMIFAIQRIAELSEGF